MLKFPQTRSILRRGAVAAISAGLLTAGAAALPATASASPSQLQMFQDNSDLANPAGAFATFRALGANTVRVIVPWALIAPDFDAKKHPNFNAKDPNAYPAQNWTEYDNIVREAAAYNLTIDLTVTGGAPDWAEGKGIPQPFGNDPAFAWKPNAADYGQFVYAVGKRYSGSFTPTGQSSPLPRVRFWSIYNEPNFGEDLGPQAIDGSTISYAPMMFRSILSAGWNALHATGHGHDTIIWGEFAARGAVFSRPHKADPQGLPGDYNQTRPLQFLRTLYCVDNNFHELRGRAASSVGCPTSAAASRRFRSQNPAMFSASGVSDHPYPLKQSPVNDGRGIKDYATFPDLGNFGAELDHLNRVYGSGKHFSIYNTEYGYITSPPVAGHQFYSPTVAATYINWAEYLSYKNPRVKSYMQYLLSDPQPNTGAYSGFASGLESSKGVPKPAYYSYRMPVFMPTTSFSHSRNVEVWGDAKPAAYASHQQVQIQLAKAQAGYTTVKTVTVGRGGYFDVHMKFAASGNVRIAWTYPTTGLDASLLPSGYSGDTVYSRTVSIKVH